MKLNNVFQRYNPFRRPDWRWDRVLQMVDRKPTPGRATKRDDPYVRQARQFILRWRNTEGAERDELFYNNAGLYLAYQMFEREAEDPDVSLFLQGRLLAGMAYKEIAEAMDTHPGMVEWYEALFFNVTDRLKARDWITKQVLVPAMVRNFGTFGGATDADDEAKGSSWNIARPFMDASLKMFSYFGGPVLCEFFISGFQQGRICQSPDGLAEWLDGHWSLTIKARSAQAARTFNVNRYNVMELFQTHARILEIEQSSDTAESKKSALENHVGALIGELRNVYGVGKDSSSLDGTDVPMYDDGAAELRDDELLQVAGGSKLKLDALELLTMPPPKATKEVPGEPK